MNRVHCGSDAVAQRPEVTARGYRRFRCQDCGRQFNGRSGGVLNRTSLLSEILLLRGTEVSHQAVRDEETKLLPVMGEERRERRYGKRCSLGAVWYMDEIYLKGRGKWAYLYRPVDLLRCRVVTTSPFLPPPVTPVLPKPPGLRSASRKPPEKYSAHHPTRPERHRC